MQKIKTLVTSASILVFALAFTASVPVFARGINSGHDESQATSDDPSVTTMSESEHTADSTKTSDSGRRTSLRSETEKHGINHVESENEQHHVNGDDDHAELHHRGAALVAELRKEHVSKKTDDERKNICENRKQGLATKFTRISAAAQTTHSRIDDILAKAEAYQQTNNLSIENYDSLVAAAHAAGTTSSSSVASLKAVTPTIDCSSSTVANDIATYKAAAQQTRDDLKAYRTAVKAVLKALISAKTTPTSTDDTAGGTQ